MILKILACIAILTLIISNIRYKMHIKSICKQVDFIRQHSTNKVIRSSGSTRSINKLIDELNEFIHIQKSMVNDYKTKDELLKETITNISHDIRTPLTSMNGYMQLLSESNSEEEKVRYIAIIEARINSLRELLEDMFTYMKVQDGNYGLNKEKCNISKIVGENLFSYYEDFKLKGIQPNIDIGEEAINIWSNRLALDRIVNNLINNSLVHGENYIGISLFRESEVIKLVVENETEDLGSIDIKNIFNRFYKSDKSRSSKSTGLGLTIVRELVESIGGEIEARVEKNIFTIEVKLYK